MAGLIPGRLAPGIALVGLLTASALSAGGPETAESALLDRYEGFWLGQSIANWTGLVTEMDRVEPPFYTDADWGREDRPNLWGHLTPHSQRIDFYLQPAGTPWGADDDTDIEYLYLHLMEAAGGRALTGEEIRDGWLAHIYSNEEAPLYRMFPDSEPVRENFLWVANERAFELMRQGRVPPATSDPALNPYTGKIDAQLTTEIFGLLAPGQPALALQLAELPIATAARHEAADIARFYVVMHALAVRLDPLLEPETAALCLADSARRVLPDSGYPARMYDFVRARHADHPASEAWPAVRDAVYARYQAAAHDGYVYEDPFDAGINFAASLVSWFYGRGDFRRTVKIGSLAGWDSDNPTATWGGLLGFLAGAEALRAEFAGHGAISDTYWIHRTRRGFPDRTPGQAGEDRFPLMAERMARVAREVLARPSGQHRGDLGGYQQPGCFGPGP